MDQLSIFLPGILLAYTATLFSLMSPGPNILAVIGTSMSRGRASGLSLAMGVACGSVCWATLTVTGLSALLSSYAFALSVSKVGGVGYLLWLGIKALRSAAVVHEIEAVSDVRRSLPGYFLRGLTVQMTNPKAALAWIAIISISLHADAPAWSKEESWARFSNVVYSPKNRNLRVPIGPLRCLEMIISAIP